MAGVKDKIRSENGKRLKTRDSSLGVKIALSVLVIYRLTLVLLVTAGGSFWLGMKYQQLLLARRPGFGGGPIGNTQVGQPPVIFAQGVPARADQAMVSGRVDKVEEGVITLTTRFGSQKISYSSGVKVEKTQAADLSEVEEGTEILVQGERKGENVFEAKEILVNFSVGR